MSNYVWHKLICRKEILERYFADTDPLGDGTPVEQPYLSFNKLFGANSLGEYSEKYGRHISYDCGSAWAERADGLCELKFCTRWEYPIRAILRTLELAHDAVWFAVEENFVYVSKFYWAEGVKEDLLYLGDDYDDWLDANEALDDAMEDPDNSIWYFLPCADGNWINWPSADNFSRYLDVSAVYVESPDFIKQAQAEYINKHYPPIDAEDSLPAARSCAAGGKGL